MRASGSAVGVFLLLDRLLGAAVAVVAVVVVVAVDMTLFDRLLLPRPRLFFGEMPGGWRSAGGGSAGGGSAGGGSAGGGSVDCFLRCCFFGLGSLVIFVDVSAFGFLAIILIHTTNKFFADMTALLVKSK